MLAKKINLPSANSGLVVTLVRLEIKLYRLLFIATDHRERRRADLGWKRTSQGTQQQRVGLAAYMPTTSTDRIKAHPQQVQQLQQLQQLEKQQQEQQKAHITQMENTVV